MTTDFDQVPGGVTVGGLGLHATAIGRTLTEGVYSSDNLARIVALSRSERQLHSVGISSSGAWSVRSNLFQAHHELEELQGEGADADEDGAIRPESVDGARQLLDYLQQLQGIPRPHVFRTAEGYVTLQWAPKGWRVRIEVRAADDVDIDATSLRADVASQQRYDVDITKMASVVDDWRQLLFAHADVRS